MPVGGISLVDFVLQVLTANKHHVNSLCSVALQDKFRKSSVVAEKSSGSILNNGGDDALLQSDPFVKCQAAVSRGIRRRDNKVSRQIFNTYKDADCMLTAATLMQALADADAPLIPESLEAAALAISHVDVDCNNAIDFGEFVRMVNAPDELALYFHEKQLPALADGLRALVGRGGDQLRRVSQLSDADTEAVAAAVGSCIPLQAKMLRDELICSFRVQTQLNAETVVDDSKFGMTKMACGSIDDFHKGLTGRVGVPHLDFKREMLREHCIRAGCNTQFTTGNYNITTTPKQEWMYVVSDELGQDGQLQRGIPCPAANMKRGRKIVPIDELMQLPLVAQAELNDFEVLALVLYTGPMFYVYNVMLRQYPVATYQLFKEGGNTFPTTIFVLVSAVTKVTKRTRIPRGTLLYRGLGGWLDLPDKFFKVDANGTSGYADWGFMSTSADLDVALGYSGLKQRRPKVMVMVMETTSVDKGADISMFSQYPCEKEFLWVPCSFVQRAIGVGSRVEVVDGGLVTFVPVKVNLNLRMETVEELKEKKKRSHVVSAFAMVDDVRFDLEVWAASSESCDRLLRDPMRNNLGTFSTASLAAAIVSQCEAVVNRHDRTRVEEYVDDGSFRMLVSEMLDVKLWAKEKIQLWMQDESQCVTRDSLLHILSVVMFEQVHLLPPGLVVARLPQDVAGVSEAEQGQWMFDRELGTACEQRPREAIRTRDERAECRWRARVSASRSRRVERRAHCCCRLCWC